MKTISLVLNRPYEKGYITLFRQTSTVNISCRPYDRCFMNYDLFDKYVVNFIQFDE